MPNHLTQIVTEKMQGLPIEELQKVVEFVDLLSTPKKQTLLEKLTFISSRVLDEVWETLPADGAKILTGICMVRPKENDQQ
jgi:hypothetical protein